VGDLEPPIYDLYDNLINDPSKVHGEGHSLNDSYKVTGMTNNDIRFYVYLIWLFWFMNCFINAILFLNILVAEVNNTY